MARTKFQPGPAIDHYHATIGVEALSPADLGPTIINETFVENFVTEITEGDEADTYITQITEQTTFVTNVTQVINTTINGKKGQANELATLDENSQLTPSQIPDVLRSVVIPFVIDGGGAAITTGVKGELQIPFDCTITGWTLLADQAGSIVIDVWADVYANYPPADADSITAAAPPTISGTTKAQSSTLTGWTTEIAADSILRFNVDSVATVERVLVSLTAERA